MITTDAFPFPRSESVGTGFRKEKLRHFLDLTNRNVRLLSSVSELQYLVAEGALAKDIAVNRK